MNTINSYILKRLDQGYHCSFYQDLTRQFPLRMPNTLADRATEAGVKSLKEFTGIILDEIKDPKKDAHLNCRLIIHETHVPTERNWTRGVNGILQATMMIGLSVFMKRVPKTATRLLALGWGSTGARHLYAAKYSPEERELYQKTARFVWQKPAP